MITEDPAELAFIPFALGDGPFGQKAYANQVSAVLFRSSVTEEKATYNITTNGRDSLD
jgi:hypothetical protein